MLQTQPAKPPAKHLSIKRTALPMSIDKDWMPSVMVVAKFDGQIESQRAQFAGILNPPSRAVREKRSHFVCESKWGRALVCGNS